MKGRRKIFIAVNIDSKTKNYIKNKLNKLIDKVSFIKLVVSDNFHVTLLYIGLVGDEEVANICEKLKKGLVKERAFDFTLNFFCWGPKKEKPKMLWMMGEKSKELTALKQNIEKALDGTGSEIRKKEFRPHINLGRIVKKLVEPGVKFEDFKEEVNINIPVSSVEVMESVSEKGRVKYFVLERLELE